MTILWVTYRTDRLRQSLCLQDSDVSCITDSPYWSIVIPRHIDLYRGNIGPRWEPSVRGDNLEGVECLWGGAYNTELFSEI